MREIYYSILFVIGLIGIASCSQDEFEIENEVNNLLSESKALLLSDSLFSDSVITPFIVNRDSVKKRVFARANYDSYLSDNLWAIRELPFSLQSREGGNTQTHFLQSNGLSQAITLANRNVSAGQHFYVKILPAVSGIPYLIYASSEGTPLAVGQRSNDPNNKVLFALPNASGSMYSADWDIYKSNTYPGYVVIESQSYLGQGSSGDWMDIFYHVWDTKGGSPVGFGQYQVKNTQEFRITPFAIFSLEEVKYVDKYSAKITSRNSHAITRSYRNEKYSVSKYDMLFEETIVEKSSFMEDKRINFMLFGLEQKFRRPSAIQGNIDLEPSENEKADALYTAQEDISKSLSVTLPLNVPPRTKMTVTYYFNTYDIETNYEAIIKCGDRETKIAGVWKGTIHVDEKVDPLIKNINLDTGEIQSFKVNIKNVTKSHPVNF